MSNLKIVLGPEERARYLKDLLRLDGLEHIEEDPAAAYCPISLTQTPDELKPFLKSRQEQLKDILSEVGIRAYDPAASTKYNPEINPAASVADVYRHNTEQVVGARFFCGHNLTASTGFGNECEKARVYNRIAVVFMDNALRVSRMQPFRTIYLGYRRFEDHQEDIKEIFRLLQKYDPGMAFNGSVPVLAGFHKDTGEVVDLEELVYTRFPHMQYKYNGEVPILKLRCENPQLFYEHGT